MTRRRRSAQYMTRKARILQCFLFFPKRPPRNPARELGVASVLAFNERHKDLVSEGQKDRVDLCPADHDRFGRTAAVPAPGCHVQGFEWIPGPANALGIYSSLDSQLVIPLPVGEHHTGPLLERLPMLGDDRVVCLTTHDQGLMHGFLPEPFAILDLQPRQLAFMA